MKGLREQILLDVETFRDSLARILSSSGKCVFLNKRVPVVCGDVQLLQSQGTGLGFLRFNPCLAIVKEPDDPSSDSFVRVEG